MNHRQGSIAIGQVPSLIPALHIWNGHASPARSQNTQVGPDSIWPSHGNPPPPFFIVDRFSRRIYALPLVVLAGRMCLGGCGGKYTTCSVPAAPVVMSCRPPRCFGCKGCSRLQPGVYLQNPPLLQTAGCHSPYSPPHPDQDCMLVLTHGECDQLKLCWARIPGVGGGWQRHDRNGFRGRGGGEGPIPLRLSWSAGLGTGFGGRITGPAALIYRVPASRSPAITAQG